MKNIIILFLLLIFFSCSKDNIKKNVVSDYYETTGTFSNIQYLIDLAKPGNTIHLLANNIYIQDNSIVLKDGITINANGATLKRNAQQTTISTNSVDEKATSINVQKVPNGWKVGDYLQIYNDNSFLTSSYNLKLLLKV